MTHEPVKQLTQDIYNFLRYLILPVVDVCVFGNLSSNMVHYIFLIDPPTQISFIFFWYRPIQRKTIYDSRHCSVTGNSNMKRDKPYNYFCTFLAVYNLTEYRKKADCSFTSMHNTQH